MQLKNKILGSGLVILAAGGIGTATVMAQASGASTPPAVHAPAKAVTSESDGNGSDTDNVQQGDQTSPDVPAAKASPKAGAADESESGSESETGATDGPGGHEDPPGNVDNQQTGDN